MPANTSPLFGLTPVIGFGQLTTANTNRDGTGTIVDLVTGGTYGTRVDFVTIKATGTTTGQIVRFFYHDGTAYRLVHEESISAATPSGSVPSFEATWTPAKPWVIPSGKKLAASTHVSEIYNIAVHGSEF